jgi:demethylmenaquinone methyltransferase/2-methoxy-6-polyprenyl-1,4-benzoquinol methylase
MSQLLGERRASYVRMMFGCIARRYDLLNRLITFGQDLRWRREAIRRLRLAPGARLLDLGAGTGDLAFEALQQTPNLQLVASDFSPEMIAIGIGRPAGDRLSWVIADVLHLPFPNNAFDGVASGFLLRNVGDLDRALAEQARVLRPAGRVVCLETTPPTGSRLLPVIRFYQQRVIPLLGRLLAGDAEAYRYLTDSTESFLGPQVLVERFKASGLRDVDFERRMLGTVAIHWARKPAVA